MNPVIINKNAPNPYASNPNAREIFPHTKVMHEGKSYTKLTYELTDPNASLGSNRLLLLVYAVSLTILTCFIALAFEYVRKCWSEAIYGATVSNQVENVTVLIAEKQTSSTESRVSSNENVLSSQSVNESVFSSSSSHSSSSSSSLHASPLKKSSSHSSLNEDLESSSLSSTALLKPDFSAEMNVLFHQLSGYVGNRHYIVEENSDINPGPDYWTNMTLENGEALSFHPDFPLWEFTVPEEHKQNMPEGFPCKLLLSSKFIPDVDGAEFRINYNNEAVTLNVDWFSNNYFFSEVKDVWPEYWQKMTYADGTALPIDPTDYVVEVHLHGDVKWKPDIAGLPKGLPPQLSLPSKWLSSISEGETLRIKYGDLQIALKANQSIPGGKSFFGDTFEKKVKDVGERFLHSGRVAFAESSYFLLKSARNDNDLYFYTLKNGGALLNLALTEKNTLCLAKSEKQELRIFPMEETFPISKQIKITTGVNCVRFWIEAPRLGVKTLHDFDIVVNEKFLILAKHKGVIDKDRFVKERDPIENVHLNQYVYYVEWNECSALKGMPLELLIQKLQDAVITLSGGLLQIYLSTPSVKINRSAKINSPIQKNTLS